RALVRPRRAALAWLGERVVLDPLRRRALERLATGRARGRGRPRPRQPRGRARGGVAAREPLLDRPGERHPIPAARRRAPAARLLRPHHGGRCPAAHALDRRLAADRAPARLERERAHTPRAAGLRAGAAPRDRPPHGRLELVLAAAVGGDRPRDRALPRARER